MIGLLRSLRFPHTMSMLIPSFQIAQYTVVKTANNDPSDAWATAQYTLMVIDDHV